LQYKKAETDGAMPKGFGPLRVKCLEIMHRASPTVSPHTLDDEASITEDLDSGANEIIMGELI
jgi:hypothetical protein